jgi:hypothetical protein
MLRWWDHHRSPPQTTTEHHSHHGAFSQNHHDQSAVHFRPKLLTGIIAMYSSQESFKRYNRDTVNERLNALLQDKDNSTRSLESAERKLILYHTFYLMALAILYWDGLFSHNSFLTYGGSGELALGIAVLIAGVQLAVNSVIFSGNAKIFIRPDFNGDGKVAWWERGGQILFFAVVFSVYLLNIGTNLINVNIQGLEEMGVALGSILLNMVPSVVLPILEPVVLALANMLPLTIGVLLCVGDEILTISADRLIAATRSAIPALKDRQAVLDAQIEDCEQFRNALLANAGEQGFKRGANYKL